MDENQIAVSTYNKVAEQYAALNFDDTSNLPYVDKFLSYLAENGKILEVGCGPGNLVKYVLSRGYEAEGIDLSEAMIRIARERVPEGTFTLMDMRHLNYAEKMFDGIMSVYSLIHIPSEEIVDTLKELRRALTPGGFLLLIVQKGEPDSVVTEPFDENAKTFINFFTRERLTGFLNAANFKLVEQEEVSTPDANEFAKSDAVIYTIARNVNPKTPFKAP